MTGAPMAIRVNTTDQLDFEGALHRQNILELFCNGPTYCPGQKYETKRVKGMIWPAILRVFDTVRDLLVLDSFLS